MNLQECLEHCQKQNGLDYCKNCGLTATIIHQALAEERARVRGEINEILDIAKGKLYPYQDDNERLEIVIEKLTASQDKP